MVVVALLHMIVVATDVVATDVVAVVVVAVAVGCSQLDTLCNRNINQPLPEKHQVVEEEDDNEIMQ